MIYSARVKKRVRYIRAYTMLKSTGKHENIITRGFIKLFSLIGPKNRDRGQAE